MKTDTASSAIAALALGAVQALALIWCWAYIAAFNPLTLWLLKAGLRGRGFLAAVTAMDFLINLLLLLPAAWLLLLLGRRLLRFHTMLAMLSLVVTGAVTVGLPMFSASAFVAISYGLLVLALPADVWLLSRFTGKAPGAPAKRTAPTVMAPGAIQAGPASPH